MSDVPIGVLLSGGVDSAVVLGLLREAGADGLALVHGRLRRSALRRASARAPRRRSDTAPSITSSSSAPHDFAAALPRLAWFRDEPIAEPSEVPLFLLAEHAARHVKVVLSGDGGDELFGGYPKYRAERLLSLPTGVPALACRLGVAAFGPGRRTAGWTRRRDAPDPQPARPLGIVVPHVQSDGDPRAPPPDTRALGEHHRPGRAAALALAPYAHFDPGRWMLLGDVLTYLPDNMLSARTKSDGRLARGPHAAARPSLCRARGRNARREALFPPLAESAAAPRDCGSRPGRGRVAPKRGFTVPVARFLLHNGSQPLQRLVLSDRALDRGLFDPGVLKRLVGGNGGRDEEPKTFSLAALELWPRTNVNNVTHIHRRPFNRADVLGCPIDRLGIDEAVDRCRELIEETNRTTSQVSVNAAKLVAIREDALLRELVGGRLVTADGQSVVWASRLLGDALPERVAGIDSCSACSSSPRTAVIVCSSSAQRRRCLRVPSRRSRRATRVCTSQGAATATSGPGGRAGPRMRSAQLRPTSSSWR